MTKTICVVDIDDQGLNHQMSLSNNMTCITSTSGLLIANEQQGMPLTLCNATKVE